MKRAGQLLGGAVAVALLAGCSGGNTEPQVPRDALGSPETTIYMPPEVPLESIVVDGAKGATADGERAFVTVAARLSQRYGTSYVKSGRSSPRAETDFWIVLTRRPDEWALAQLATLPVPVEVKYGAPATLSELADVESALTASLLSRQDEFAGVEADPSRFATRIVVRYGNVGGGWGTGFAGHAASFNEALAAGAKAAADQTLPVPVDFVHDPARDVPGP